MWTLSSNTAFQHSSCYLSCVKFLPMFPDIDQPCYCLLSGPFDPSEDMVRFSLPYVYLENWRWFDHDPPCHAARLFSYGPALRWHYYHRCEIFSVASAYKGDTSNPHTRTTQSRLLLTVYLGLYLKLFLRSPQTFVRFESNQIQNLSFRNLILLSNVLKTHKPPKRKGAHGCSRR